MKFNNPKTHEFSESFSVIWDVRKNYRFVFFFTQETEISFFGSEMFRKFNVWKNTEEGAF